MKDEPTSEGMLIGPPANVAYDNKGRLTKAGEGFAKRIDCHPDDLVIVTTSRGQYVAAHPRTTSVRLLGRAGAPGTASPNVAGCMGCGRTTFGTLCWQCKKEAR